MSQQYVIAILPFCFQAAPVRQSFSEVEWAELDQIWRGHRTIVGATKILLGRTE